MLEHQMRQLLHLRWDRVETRGYSNYKCLRLPAEAILYGTYQASNWTGERHMARMA